jgi:serine/threonine protein kinase
VQIKLATDEAYRKSLKPYLDASFTSICKALRLVEHPNVLPLLDAGYFKDMPFTVTDYLVGGSLKQFTGTSRNWRDVFSILLPIADALCYCHDHSIIHRDVRPQNIVINNNGDLCLTNFSLFGPTSSNKLSVTLTGSGECFPAYIAPEIWNGRSSPAVDQYSFGVMLYELLTASLPFDASNVVSLLVQQATEPIVAPSSLVPNVPKEVETLIEKSLAGDSSARYESMRDVRNMMQELLDDPALLQTKPAPKVIPKKRPKATSTPRTGKEQILRSDMVNNKNTNAEISSSKENPQNKEHLKKRTKTITIVMLSILVVSILCCAAVFLFGLLRQIKFFSDIADKFSNLIESHPSEVASDIPIPNPQPNPTWTSSTSLSQIDEHHCSLVVNQVGGATANQYYETSYSSALDLPVFHTPVTNEIQYGYKETTVNLPIGIKTSDRLGVSIQILENKLSRGVIHIYKSAQVEMDQSLSTCISLVRGDVFVATEGKPICVSTSISPEEEIWVHSGKMLVEATRIDITIWCLEGECEIMSNGTWKSTIETLTRSNYIDSGGGLERKSSTQIGISLVDELKRFDLECDYCVNLLAVKLSY